MIKLIAEDEQDFEVDAVKEFIYHDIDTMLTKLEAETTCSTSDKLLFRETKTMLRQLNTLPAKERTSAVRRFMHVKSEPKRTLNETFPPAWVGLNLMEIIFHSHMSVQPEYTREKMRLIRGFVEARIPDDNLPSISKVMRAVEQQPHLDPYCLITGQLAEIKTNESQRTIAFHLYVLALAKNADFELGFHPLRLKDIASALVDPGWSMGKKQRVWLEHYLVGDSLLSDLSSPSGTQDSYVYKVNPRMGPHQMADHLMEDMANSMLILRDLTIEMIEKEIIGNGPPAKAMYYEREIAKTIRGLNEGTKTETIPKAAYINSILDGMMFQISHQNPNSQQWRGASSETKRTTILTRLLENYIYRSVIAAPLQMDTHIDEYSKDTMYPEE